MSKSNTQLQMDVLQELKFEPSIDAAGIGVTAKDGIVSLTGYVNSYVAEYTAVHAAERVAGVKAVTDELKVDLPSCHVCNDEDVASAVLHALQWDVLVPNERIKVKVADGWVTLDGEVDFNYQKTAAENAVRNLTGVRGVTSLIALKKPAVMPSEIKANIEYALRRAAEVDAEHITIKVVDDKVILKGNVSSCAERSEAERVAWSTPGVTTVVDDLVIAA